MDILLPTVIGGLIAVLGSILAAFLTHIAPQRNLTAFDACYAVLTQQLEIPLVTADESMAKAVECAVTLEDFKL
jgi:predicted nucleic acid-binding protein